MERHTLSDDRCGATEAATETINDWDAGRTANAIGELLGSRVAGPSTELICTKAVYFKGDWSSKFDPKATAQAPFRLSGGKSVDVPFMHQTASFGHLEGEGDQVLELPYAKESLSMAVALPKTTDGRPALEASLTAQTLGDWVGKLEETEVAVTLPRSSLEAELRLDRVLPPMGMKSALGGGADFSAMARRRGLQISAIVHKATAKLGEEGTTAAAATAVTMAGGVLSEPPASLADHPCLFLFAIGSPAASCSRGGSRNRIRRGTEALPEA